MKRLTYFAIVLTAALMAGCSNNQPSATPNAANTTAVATPAPNVAESVAPTSSTPGSPTEVFKSQNEARKNKDAATMKQNLSRASLALIEEAAKRDNMPVDDWLVVEEEGVDQVDTFESRNEKITGDTATIEISLTGTNDWAEMPFVKEDGRWKIAMDKYLANVEKEFEENTEPTEEETKPETNPQN